MIIEMDNDRFELKITSKEYWKDLSYSERREYEDNGQFELLSTDYDRINQINNT